MNDHPSYEELLALPRQGLPAARTWEILRHLLTCEPCLAQAPPPLGILMGYEPARSAPVDEEAYEASIEKVFAEVRKVAKHLQRERTQVKKALKVLDGGGMEALQRLPKTMGWLARMEACLARSWAVRYEDTDQMIQFALLAVQCAERLDARSYGAKRVSDFQCRARAELGNALRVTDQLEEARWALGRARELFERGTGDALLEVRLLDLEASLDIDLRRFGPACMKLTKIYRYHRRFGDDHSAGRALLQMGVCHRAAGNPEEALRLLQRSAALLDESRDPVLTYIVAYNRMNFLVELGQFRDAEKQLFLLRRLRSHTGGQINQLRLRWEEGRIDAGLGRLARAEKALREVREGFLEVNRAYDSALASLDLAAVLLERGRSDDAAAVSLPALKTFIRLGIGREALMAVAELRIAFELRQATRAMVEEAATFLRRYENDPAARFEGKAWGHR